MNAEVKQYRYSSAVRQRALIWGALSGILCLGLLGVLVVRWADFSWGTRMMGLTLLLILLFTIRAQLGRVLYRCYIEPDRLRIVAPLAKRIIPWTQISEVRRLKLPQMSSYERWACTVQLQGRDRSTVPVFVFDDQLEDAEAALQDVIRRTPQAQHTNVVAENPAKR
ncbi:MAG: PH domain-containing protein [Chloroflexota bacterium]|nr:PH domain-containing protein [Chloroflexota bacterium]